MSQYTISLKSIINLYSHRPPYNDDVFADTKKKIERGREIFFNFDYAGDEEFQNLFEEKFLIKNLQEDICFNDIELWLMALKNDVTIKAPIYYNRYKAIQELKASELGLGEKVTHDSERDINREGTNKVNDTSSSNTHNESSSSAENSASSSSNGKTKSSQFPQDIENATNFGSIRYMDGGTASQDSSSSSGSSSGSTSGSSSGSSQTKSSGENTMDEKDVLHETTVREINKLDKINEYLSIQADIITEFVNSFNNLFMSIW